MAELNVKLSGDFDMKILVGPCSIHTTKFDEIQTCHINYTQPQYMTNKLHVNKRGVTAPLMTKFQLNNAIYNHTNDEDRTIYPTY